MEELKVKANYYALFLSIVKNMTAKNALIAMGIAPESLEKENIND